MLSTITPLSERSRQHRFGATATWFVTGAILGGLALGALSSVGALLIGYLDLSETTTVAAFGIILLIATAFDLRWLRPTLPHHRRQVNENWLDEFRPWVYGAGFGAQIGFGFLTYIMTAGVYTVALAAVLTGSPIAAIGIGVLFGLTRGLVVLTGLANTDQGQLIRFHQRFAAADEPSRRVMIGLLGVSGLVTLAIAFGAPWWTTVASPLAFLLGLAYTAALTRSNGTQSISGPSDLLPSQTI